MNWTPLGDLEQTSTLSTRERPCDLEDAFDLVDHVRVLVTGTTVLYMGPIVGQLDLNLLEWPLFSGRVQPKRHGRAGTQGSEQQVIGRRSKIVSGPRRLVGYEDMAPCPNFLREPSLPEVGNAHRSL